MTLRFRKILEYCGDDLNLIDKAEQHYKSNHLFSFLQEKNYFYGDVLMQ